MEVMSTFLGGGCGTATPYHEGSKYAGFSDLDIKGLSGEVLPIDDLLDFSSEEIAGPIWKGCSQIAENCSDTSYSAANQTVNEILPSEGLKSQPLSLNVDSKEPIAGIGVSCEEIAELEWLSNFVEESFSLDQEYKFLATLGVINLEKTVDRCSGRNLQFQTSSPVSVLETSSINSADRKAAGGALSLPGRARSKRSRTGIRSWPNGSSSMILESSPAVSEFSTFSDPPSLSPSSVQSAEKQTTFIDIAAKDQLFPTKCFKYESKRKQQADQQYPIRCTHCGIQKTPQWRAGPLGPKTLCNACGVRYKSGRLLPEYRPAASPEYVPEKHSNSHKRVLEMRLQKELKLLHKQQE